MEHDEEQMHRILDAMDVPRVKSVQRYGLNQSWEDVEKYDIPQRLILLAVEIGRLRRIEKERLIDRPVKAEDFCK